MGIKEGFDAKALRMRAAGKGSELVVSFVAIIAIVALVVLMYNFMSNQQTPQQPNINVELPKTPDVQLPAPKIPSD
jgi:hypothetical protein